MVRKEQSKANLEVITEKWNKRTGSCLPLQYATMFRSEKPSMTDSASKKSKGQSNRASRTIKPIPTRIEVGNLPLLDERWLIKRWRLLPSSGCVGSEKVGVWCGSRRAPVSPPSVIIASTLSMKLNYKATICWRIGSVNWIFVLLNWIYLSLEANWILKLVLL